MDIDKFSVGDLVTATNIGNECNGVVWKVSEYGVHVRYGEGEKTMFQVFHFNPNHHMQTPISSLSKTICMNKITLCGSTKFKNEFEKLNQQLTLEGNIVYSVSCFAHSDNIRFTIEQKEMLDKVHKLKIDNSDGIFVIDVDGYIGESTKSEILHAEKTGKFVKYLSAETDYLNYIKQQSK